ncbi:MAG: DUF3179 domain-containing protein [Dehalococcoidia bacterium]
MPDSRTLRRPRRRLGALLVGLTVVLVAAACAGGDDDSPRDTATEGAAPAPEAAPEPTGESEAAAAVPGGSDGASPGAEAAEGGRGVIAGVDTSIRSVDLEDIEFDLFNGSKISLAEIDEQTILRLIDVIPPLDAALELIPPSGRSRVGRVRYIPAQEADFLREDDVVQGYVAEDGQPYAFSLGILQFHEIVNDTLGGRAVLISYCPLCRSGVVYDRVVDGQLLTFGNTSALLQNDLVMFDRQTNSYWFQIGGEAVVGPLTGSRLRVLPSVLIPWSAWLRDHPDTLVLSTDTGFVRSYTVDLFAGFENSVDAGRLPFSVDEEILADTRLPLSELVLGVEIGELARAYPLNQLGDAAVNDEFGGRAVVVFSSANGPTGAAYDPVIDGRRLTFDEDGGNFRDRQTGSLWTLSGRAIEGPLAGEQLTAIPARTAFWFSYLSAFPNVEVAPAELPGDAQ